MSFLGYCAEYWGVAALALFFASIALLAVRLCYQRRAGTEDVPPQVVEASHELRNEATKLRGALTPIKRADDPVRALVELLTAGRSRYHHRPENHH